MTITSLKLLAHFLNTYPQEGRIADYGGTDIIGGKIVKQMMELDNVEVIENMPQTDVSAIDIGVKGLPKWQKPKYVVLDYDNGVDLMKPIKGQKFDGGICMDLLEHTENPFVIAKNISNSLKKGALLFVTVPWIWELHYYPKDYWRFAPQGLEELFKPNMECITVEIIRDAAPEEEVARARLVGVFKKK